MRDDDNVFDVAFENQGGEAAEHTVSATDIKVCAQLLPPWQKPAGTETRCKLEYIKSSVSAGTSRHCSIRSFKHNAVLHA